MAHANVSNGVLTIIASFSNGLDVLKKLQRSSTARQSKGKKRKNEDALRLSRSLRSGPEEIGREYQAGSMHCDSERYAIGDGKPGGEAMCTTWLTRHSYCADLAGRDPAQTEHWHCWHHHLFLESRQTQRVRSGLPVFDKSVRRVAHADHRCPSTTLPTTDG